LQQYDTIQEIRISDHRPVFMNLWARINLPSAEAVLSSGGSTMVPLTGMSSSQVCTIS
jgi:hypothetical protein